MKVIIKKNIESFFIPNIVYVLLVGLVVRLVLSFFGTLQLDQGTFVAWSINLAENGFRNFYNSWSDYLPGYLYVLWFLGKIDALKIIPQTILYKLPSILSDIITGYLIYKIIRKDKSRGWALAGSAIYIFNPAVLANSTLWGQADSLTALAALLSLYLLPKNIFISALSLSAGALIKPQVAFIFPVILFQFFRLKKSMYKLFLYCLAGLGFFISAFLPFWNHGYFISFVINRFGVSLGQYPYTSVNAINFWALFGFWKPDNLYYQFLGYGLVIILTVLLMFRLRKAKNAEYTLAAFIFTASFSFFTRMHERHLLPALAPLAVVAAGNSSMLFSYFVLSLTYVLNLYYSFIWITHDFKAVFSDFFVKFLALLNIGVVGVIYFAPKIFEKFRLIFFKVRTFKPEFKFLPVHLDRRNRNYLLGAILFFAFFTRIFYLGSPPNEYFDEVYHAFTAKVILHGDIKAWEWWNTPPEGFAYEWTHPPLAKLGMFVGMKVFGENSFGYRIPGALLGLGAIFLVYLLSKEIFKDELLGLISAAVFSLDGLVLVMSRIAMNDTYLLFFALFSIYLFLKKKDFWSAVTFGLALSSKWSAVWVIPILGVLWFWRRKKFTFSILWFLLLPFCIYLLSYLPMFLTGHDLSIWWGMQKQMWWYHTGLNATHPYTSQWWSWPLLVRPIYLYTSDEIGGMVSRIYAFGNPLVFWFGLASVLISFIYSYLEKNRHLGLVVFAYLVFFVPWALSPRIMFLYHYLPSIPFLSIASGFVLRRNPKLIPGYLFVCLLIFIYFYPHWAGLKIPLWLDQSYYWISSWR